MNVSTVSFKGYDARPLKRLVCRDAVIGEPFYQAVNQVARIGTQNDFDVFVQTPEQLVNKDYNALKSEKKFPNALYFPWTQDSVTFTPKNTMAANCLLAEYNQILAEKFKVPYLQTLHHVQGGNFFFIKERNKNALLIGRDELKYYSAETIKKDFGIERIYPVSQPDFHIDLGIRPLNNRTVLVNDPNITLKGIDKGIRNADNILEQEFDAELLQVRKKLNAIKKCFIKAMSDSKEYGNFNNIQRELKLYGFKPVMVPGSIIRTTGANDINNESHYIMNFLNAIVHERADDHSLIYITNDSLIDEFVGITPEIEQRINFSFKKEFTEKVGRYIEPENIHFIQADFTAPLLEYAQGGIHCVFAEQANI